MAGEGCYRVESCQKSAQGWSYSIPLYNANGEWRQTSVSAIVATKEECDASRAKMLNKELEGLIPSEFRRLCTNNDKPRRRSPMAFQINLFWTWNRS